MKIYKYTTIETALIILKSGRLLLNNPSVFNDPFDTDLKHDPEDAEKTKRIMTISSYLTKLVALMHDPNIGSVLKKDSSFRAIQQEYWRVVDKLKLTHRFDESISFPKYREWLSIDTSKFMQNATRESQEALSNIERGILETNETILVTCFSKDPKSILMWSHYGDKHKGVCLEYERPESFDFVDMKYSDKRPKIKTSKLTSFVAAKTILGEDYNQNIDQTIISEMMEPYQTKANGWEYEQEVRCMITTNSNSKSLSKDEDKYFYKMPKPTKIIIGCRAGGEEMNELIKLAKKMKIKYVFLKKDKETFLLREK